MVTEVFDPRSLRTRLLPDAEAETAISRGWMRRTPDIDTAAMEARLAAQMSTSPAMAAAMADMATAFASSTDARLGDQRTPADGSVTDVKITPAGLSQSRVTGLAAALAAKADLVDGRVPTSQIPALALHTGIAVPTRAAMLALTPAQVQSGDVASVATDPGRGTYQLQTDDPSQLTSWLLLNSPTDVVQSINGQNGVIVLTKTDLGLGNVNNTADADKPVSTAQAAAIASAATAAATIDTTALPRTAGIAAAGSATKAARADHIHPRVEWAPQDHGLITWTFDPSAVSGVHVPASGVLQMLKVRVPAAATATNLVLHVAAGGLTLTTGSSYAALYDAALTLRGQTADQTVNWTSIGLKVMPLTTPAQLTAGEYYIGICSVGLTRPGFARGGDTALGNVGLPTAAPRWATSSTGLTTSLPAAAGSLTAMTATVWGAIS